MTSYTFDFCKFVNRKLNRKTDKLDQYLQYSPATKHSTLPRPKTNQPYSIGTPKWTLPLHPRPTSWLRHLNGHGAPPWLSSLLTVKSSVIIDGNLVHLYDAISIVSYIFIDNITYSSSDALNWLNLVVHSHALPLLLIFWLLYYWGCSPDQWPQLYYSYVECFHYDSYSYAPTAS